MLVMSMVKGGLVVSSFIRYTCKAELLPVIEGALAANGYVLDKQSRENSSDAHMVVLWSGSSAVLLAELPNNDMAEIEVWGASRSATADLLESLPTELHRYPHLRSAQ